MPCSRVTRPSTWDRPLTPSSRVWDASRARARSTCAPRSGRFNASCAAWHPGCSLHPRNLPAETCFATDHPRRRTAKPSPPWRWNALAPKSSIEPRTGSTRQADSRQSGLPDETIDGSCLAPKRRSSCSVPPSRGTIPRTRPSEPLGEQSWEESSPEAPEGRRPDSSLPEDWEPAPEGPPHRVVRPASAREAAASCPREPRAPEIPA